MAIVGAGPSGLVAAKHALQAGFDVAVFEASDDLGGQWHATAAHSGVWPGMQTNTSRAMTAFSDFGTRADYPLHPTAEQIHAYLRAYAEHFGVTDRIRLHTPVGGVSRARAIDGEPFDGVIVASGRFRKPGLTRLTATSSTPLIIPVPSLIAIAARWSMATGSVALRSPPTSQASQPSSQRSASPAT